MVAQECLPALGWRLSAPCHVFSDRGLTNVNAELEEFAMDSGSAPEWIGMAHFSDQLANFDQDLRPAAAVPRLPSPEQAKARTMPSDDSLWLNGRQGVHPARRKSIEGGKDQAIETTEGEPLR